MTALGGYGKKRRGCGLSPSSFRGASEPVILSAAGAKDLREGSVHTRPTRSANGQRTVRTVVAGPCPQAASSARRNVANGPGPSACSSAHTAEDRKSVV